VPGAEKVSERKDNLKHIAIILDGNGRWAEKRGLSRSEGHKEGAHNLDRMLEYFLTLNIPYISLYAFSTENWKRPVAEISGIWKLLNHFFKVRLDHCVKNGIHIKVSGDLSKLPKLTQSAIRIASAKTGKSKARLTANFCINYGSRNEILHAAGEIVNERISLFKNGKLSDAVKPVNEEELSSHLYTSPLPDVDLMIRPGGESRISNFLLWQSAYAEIYVTPVLWPDFNEKELDKAIRWYKKRDRRFGGLSDTV
jgi:undecaprenyl diphosphate synthase